MARQPPPTRSATRRSLPAPDMRADDRGASAVEYGLVMAAIAAILAIVIFGLGGVVKENFLRTTTCIEAAADAHC